MAKEIITRKKLEAVLMERCMESTISNVIVTPHKDGHWTATFVAPPGRLIDLQIEFDAIVKELRAKYDLKDEY
jgi:hypothetical protein